MVSPQEHSFRLLNNGKIFSKKKIQHLSCSCFDHFPQYILSYLIYYSLSSWQHLVSIDFFERHKKKFSLYTSASIFPPKDCIFVNVSQTFSYQVSMDFFLFLKDTHHIYERWKVNHRVIRKWLSEFGPWEHPVTHQQRLEDAGCISLSSWCDFDNESGHLAYVCRSRSSFHCKTIPVAARRLEIKLEIDWWMTSLKWSAEM